MIYYVFYICIKNKFLLYQHKCFIALCVIFFYDKCPEMENYYLICISVSPVTVLISHSTSYQFDSDHIALMFHIFTRKVTQQKKNSNH